MKDLIVDFQEADIEAAISIIAKSESARNGRHPEWIKRRLREAIAMMKHDETYIPPDEPYLSAGIAVLKVAAQLGEFSARDVPTH